MLGFTVILLLVIAFGVLCAVVNSYGEPDAPYDWEQDDVD